MRFLRKFFSAALWATLGAAIREPVVLILHSLGWGPLIVSALVASGLAMWAWLSNLPGPLIATVGIGSLASLLIIIRLVIYGIKWWRDGNSSKPIISAELETTVSPIGDFTPACAIRVTNTGPELEETCLVQIEDHGLKMHMPDPLVIRTEGQIRSKRSGRFTLSTGQPKLVPILFRESGRINQFRFIGEDGENYLFVGGNLWR